MSGPNLENLEKWRLIGAATTDINGEVVAKCDIVFICVKPHILQICASQIENQLSPAAKEKDKIFVSVLAGISLDQLEKVSDHHKFVNEIILSHCFFFNCRHLVL